MQQLINSRIEPLTIGNMVITDEYHITSINTPHQIVKDIIYPMTVGRDYIQLGGQQDDNTSLTVTFGTEGNRACRIYEESYDLYWRKLQDINSVLRNTPITTVSCYLFRETDMRVEFRLGGAPIVGTLRDKGIVFQYFEMKVSKYRDIDDPYDR
jgi:hypothetical protein